MLNNWSAESIRGSSYGIFMSIFVFTIEMGIGRYVFSSSIVSDLLHKLRYVLDKLDVVLFSVLVYEAHALATFFKKTVRDLRPLTELHYVVPDCGDVRPRKCINVYEATQFVEHR